MNSTKEKLLDNTYRDYLELMMYDFPIEKMSELVADDVKGFGSTQDEKFREVQRLRQMVIDQRVQGAGIEIQWNKTPIDRRLSPEEDTAIYTDEFLLTMKLEEGEHVIPLRLSSVFEFNSGSWKLVHIHGSMGADTEEGDTWHKDEWKKKNEELQRLVDEKTAELHRQNRELEIEAALERVRARTMAMQKSEELAEAATLLFQQVKKLGIETYSSGFNIWNENKQELVSWMSNPSGILNPSFIMPLTEYNQHARFYKAWKDRVPFIEDDIIGERLVKHYEYLRSFPLLDKAFSTSEEKGIKTPDRQVHNAVFFSYGYLLFITLEPSAQNHDIFKRFGKVFEQTYTRFLDLKKAEAQAREAQIEAALERVRAASMAMHSSDQLIEVASELRVQLIKLEQEGLETCAIHLYDESPDYLLSWSASQSPDGNSKTLLTQTRFPKKGVAILEETMEGYHSKEIDHLAINDTKRFDEFLGMLRKYAPDIHAVVKHTVRHLKNIEIKAYWSIAYFKGGALIMTTVPPPQESSRAILRRFAKVFEQAYTRFLDLQKAEKQTREAQIEASLERVRSKAMAMHSSKDISDATAIVFNELTNLNIQMERCGIALFYENTSVMEIWSTVLSPENKQVVKIVTGKLDAKIHPMLENSYRAWKNQDDFFSYQLKGNEVKEYYNKLAKEASYQFPKVKNYPQSHILNSFPFPDGGIFLYSECPLPDESINILQRFTKVFSLTYRRYQDLIKAEKQAREAEIEMSLERIRAKAMAMRNSSDIPGAVAIVFNELGRLGIIMERCGICIFNDPPTAELWSTPLSPRNKQVIDVVGGKLNFEIHPLLAGALESWKNKEDYYSYALRGKEVPLYYELLQKVPDYRFPLVNNYPDCQIINTFNFNEGLLFAYSLEPLSEEYLNIFLRFTKVFSLTFRRYQDLIKAEKQAREAQIEAALERIRSRTMAMRKSDELQEVVTTVAERLHDLGIIVDAGGVILCTYFQNSKDVRHWIAAPDFSYSGSYLLPYFNHVIFNDAWESRLRGDEFFTKAYSVDEKDSFFTYAFEHSDYKYFPNEFKQWMFAQKQHTLTFAWTKNSALLIPSHTGFVPSESDRDILKRFAQVFEQAYIRFLDIQKAEIQAKEALKQASLDRVRGEIASMRNSEDLNRITPVIWRELKALEVPFFRCGVFIVNEAEQRVEVYLSTPEGKAIAAMNLAADANDLTKNTVEHWRKKRIFRTHWDSRDFINWTRSMMDLGQVKSAETYQGSAPVPESLHLHFVPFKQGMLYVGNSEQLSYEKTELVKTLAEAFSIAYARYEDFKNLEAAKNKIELTLSELKAAQSQLIQAEKMASLGELTAGIAHEIQNPLNFVNNFSELNSELIDELKEELAVGNAQLASEIADDLKLNEQKINHHGKRAESIVKGMLLHSRGSSGQKELTDINALCDEYLRLSYHGFRAKDNSFNAEFKLEADERLPKIEVVPQDIGRVLLNLINNAFFAVNERAKLQAASYKPLVIVSSNCAGNTIEICVKDNGPGIPEQVRDKIFQPFFTTKPTGQGTGLGLSLSYDIVKAHGGFLRLNAKENEGTEFIIQIPTD